MIIVAQMLFHGFQSFQSTWGRSRKNLIGEQKKTRMSITQREHLLPTQVPGKQAEEVEGHHIYSYPKKWGPRKNASSQTKEIGIYVQIVSRYIVDAL